MPIFILIWLIKMAAVLVFENLDCIGRAVVERAGAGQRSILKFVFIGEVQPALQMRFSVQH